MIRGFRSSRIRERFANIQSSCTTETALPQFSSFCRFSRSVSAPVHSSQGVQRLSYLKRGIERYHLGVTARHPGRVLEFCWHTISYDCAYETNTGNIAGGWSWISIDTLDSGLARSTVRSNRNSEKSPFQFLRSVLAASLQLCATSRSRFS
jgi:hypothetical protein